MKKVIFMMLACIGLLFASCKGKGNSVEDIDASKLDNTVEKCWKITYSLKGHSASSYLWATEQVAVLAMQYALDQAGMGSYKYSEVSASDKDSCEDKNED